MADRDFRTAAEARAAERAQRLAAADRAAERVKRAVEAALAAYGSRPRERGEVQRYCKRIGLQVSHQPGAGLEFTVGDLEALGAAIEAQPAPAALTQFLD